MNYLPKPFYTYIHLKSDTGEVFYVGKGRKTRYKTTKKRSLHWNNTVSKHGFTPIILKFYDSEEEAYSAEIELIRLYKKIGISLVNKTEGGDAPPSRVGCKHSEETKRKISESHKGKIKSEQHKANLSGCQIGRKDSDETRKRKSIAQTGRIVSQATKDKIRLLKLGIKRSPNRK